jgi:hypothetical protein
MAHKSTFKVVARERIGNNNPHSNCKEITIYAYAEMS